MGEKILSISIASYNVEEYLNNTLESLVVDKETLRRLEIIIVNDGSGDDTLKIAQKWENDYPDTIIAIDKENGGYGSTINSSLNIAKGKYYKLLDGDDWFEKDNLSEFISYLEKAEADIVISPYYDVRKNKEFNDRHSEIPSHKVKIEDMDVNDLYFAMHEIAIKTDLLRSQEKKIAEHCFYTDAEFVFYCIAAANTISRFGKPIYCYRLGLEGQSVSLAGTRKHYKDLPIVSERIYECYEDNKYKLHGTKKKILEQTIDTITHNTYCAYMVLESPQENKKELIEYDKNIKYRHKDIYKITSRSKTVRACRNTRFLMYKALSKFVLSKYSRDNK